MEFKIRPDGHLLDYPKLKRINIGLTIRGKKYATKKDIERILKSDEVIIEEKIDGKHYSEVFEWFDDDFQFFYEFMKYKHSIKYECLPDYKIYFDVWDRKRKKFLNYDEKVEVFKTLGLSFVPLLYRGRVKSVEFLKSFIGRPSKYCASSLEGILIKVYEPKPFFLKMVDPRFDDVVDNSVHYLRRKSELNIIK